MSEARSSGVLLHVSSLPSPYGIGDLGPGAHAWIDFLAAARQRVWQVLPPGPPAVRGEHSPYRAESAFAGNALLVSPALLAADGLLDGRDLAAAEVRFDDRVDFAAVAHRKRALLDVAFARFEARGDHAAFDGFCDANAAWLDDYARFRVIAARHPDRPWWEWPAPQRDAGPDEADLRREKFVQFVFETQWAGLRAHARARGVRLFGDVPFYVDGESADAWSRRDLFKLDAAGRPAAVAGVPPDAFSETGQLWGNPVYDWQAHARDGFAWWAARIRRSLAWFDLVRIDHFRGIAAHWEVPAGSADARAGAWVEGPGRALLDAIARAAPAGSLVAEDLGVITDDVRDLIRAAGLPGMRVLLFAFDGGTAGNPHAPHRHVPDAVVYTGTHDNNTARGWFETDAGAAQRARLARYIGRECHAGDVAGSLVRLAMMSVCRTAVIPAQDLFGLGGDARMNRPSVAAGNWAWRLDPRYLTEDFARHLAALTETYGRT